MGQWRFGGLSGRIWSVDVGVRVVKVKVKVNSGLGQSAKCKVQSRK